MITFEDQINEDTLCLALYFEKMFELLENAKSNKPKLSIRVRDNVEPYTPTVQMSHLIKPSMLINTYSLFDYWIKRLCENQKKTYNLELGWKDIKEGKHDLHTYHKYLTKYSKINSNDLIRDYQGIDNLRMIRNKFIHQGGNISDQEVSEMKAINDITVDPLGIIIIHDKFVWTSLEYVKNYLLGVAKC